MLTLNQTFEDTRTIKILVVPLGSNTLFDRYFEIVSRLREIPFYELNWPQLATSTASTKPKILRNFNLSNGSLRFEYLRYDRVSLGPGDLDNFQSSKRVLMIIGLVNYPEIVETASKIEEEFDYYSRKNPNVILRRIFVFNYFFDEPISKLGSTDRPVPKSFSKDPTSVIVFPPEGNCGEGAISMVDVHLQEVMAHTSVKLINSLEKQLNHCEEARLANNLPVYASLSTHYDEIEDAEGSTSFGSKTNRKNVKRGLGGRIHKWMGDLCMQMCSPLDAVENYAFAINESRTNNDSLWLAGALDGYASSILLLITFQYALEDILGRDLRSLAVTSSTTSVQQTENGEAVNILENVEGKCVRLAEERAFEAAVIYSKNMAYSFMEVECLLRLARMYETNQWVVEREQKILEYVTKATAVAGLNAQQHIECMLEGALIFNRLGMRRKYGFFLYATVLLCIECDNFSFAQSLIRFTGEQFGIVSPFSGIVDRPVACDEGFVIEPHLSWSKMRAVLFTYGISIATDLKDNFSATRYISALLRLMSNEELRHSMTRQDWTVFQDLYFRIKEFQSANVKAPIAFAFVASPAINSRTIPRPAVNISAEDGIFSSPAPPLRKLHASPPLTAAMISGYSHLVNYAHSTIDSQDHLYVESDNYSGGSMQNNRSGDEPVFSHANSKGAGFDPHHGRRISKDNSQAQLRLPLYSSVSGKESPADRNSRRLSSDSYVVHGSGGGNRLLTSNSQKESNDPKLNYVNLLSDKSCSFFPKMSAKLLESIENDNNANIHPNSTGAGNIENGTLTWAHKEVQYRQMKELVVAAHEFRDENNRIAHISADFVSFLSSVLSEGLTPTPQQDETIDTFMALTRRVPANSKITLPVSLISLRPRRFVSKEGSPISATHCAAIQAAQKNYAKFYSAGSGSLSEHSIISDRANAKSSALFFDPFAKKRAKQQQDSEIISRQVLWPIGGDYFLVAVFRNPFSAPIVLSCLQPILDCNSCRNVCSIHLFPVSVTIPARAERFEVDLRVQIHPMSGTINSIEKSVKVLGIHIRINNAECSVLVDKLGLVPPIRNSGVHRKLPSTSELSSLSSTDNPCSGVSTNEVIVISPLPRLMLDFTGLPAAKQLDDSEILNSTYHSAVDLNIAIDIFPGEKRTETLAIKQLPLFVHDELGRKIRFDGSSAGSDLKISISEVESQSNYIGQTHGNKKLPTSKTTEFLNYSRFLCVPNTDCSPATATGSNDKKSSSLKSEHFRLKSFETETTDLSAISEDCDRAFHADLITMEFSYPENAVSVYMDIEIPTSFDKANLEYISRMSRESDLHAVVEKGLSIHTVYARRLRLRIDLIPQLGLHLSNANIIGNSRLLDESEVLTRYSLMRTLQYYYPGEDEAPEVEIAHDHITVSYEVFNRSNFSMLLDSNHSIESTFNDVDVENESFPVINTCGSGIFSSKSTSILRIPAFSSRKILLRYPPGVASQIPCATLRWACNDTTVKKGRRIRFGKFVSSVATTNRSSQSSHRNVIFQPPVRVSCTMSLLNGHNHTKTNEVTVKLRTFVDIEVLVCLTQGATTTQLDSERLELVLTILNRDMLVVDGQKSASAHRDYIVSGGMHRKILLKGLVGDSIMHKFRVCFLRQGSYSIHPLFRLVSSRFVWWTSPEKLLITVNLD